MIHDALSLTLRLASTFTASVGYRGIQGRLKPTLDFVERQIFRLNSPNYDRITLNSSEPKPSPI